MTDEGTPEEITNNFLKRVMRSSPPPPIALTDIQNGARYPANSLQAVIDENDPLEKSRKSLAFLGTAVGGWKRKGNFAVTNEQFMPGVIREIRSAIPQDVKVATRLTALQNSEVTIRAPLVVSISGFEKIAREVGYTEGLQVIANQSQDRRR